MNPCTGPHREFRPPPATVPRRRRPAAARPARRAGAAPGGAELVAYPDAASVPDWSPETVTLLEDLTPLQRTFVEWYVTGSTAAEAYRKASGRDPGPTARNNGSQLLNKPRVRVAVAAAMRDRNFDARSDREWMLMNLRAVVEHCSGSGRVEDMNSLIAAIRLMARLQGELQPLSRRRALPPPEPPGRPPSGGAGSGSRNCCGRRTSGRPRIAGAAAGLVEEPIPPPAVDVDVRAKLGTGGGRPVPDTRVDAPAADRSPPRLACRTGWRISAKDLRRSSTTCGARTSAPYHRTSDGGGFMGVE